MENQEKDAVCVLEILQVLDSTAVLNILIFFRFVNINAQTQF
jgi:hypothetical protein